VYVWHPSANGAYTSARVASFDGWGAWPPPALTYADVQNSETGYPLSGVTLLAQTNRAMGPPSFDLLYEPMATDPGNFCVFPLQVSCAGVDGSNGGGGFLNGTAAFLATGGEAGGDDPFPFATRQMAGTVTPAYQSGDPPYTLIATPQPNFGGYFSMGCSATPIVADAVDTDVGWLVAAGLGSPLFWQPEDAPGEGDVGACGFDISVGPSTNLSVATVAASSYTDDSSLVETRVLLQAASDITRVRMANRAGAAGGSPWIVWSLDGAATLTAAILSKGLTLGPTFPIAAAGGTLVPTSFAIAPFGTELVIAAVDQMAGGNDQVQVNAMDESGATTWSATVQTGGAVDGAVSLRAAPDESSLLLAWSELPPGATTHRLRVARLDCSTCAADGAACTAASDCCGARCDHGTCATAVTLVGKVCTNSAECRPTEACDPTLGICIASTVCKSDADCTFATDICNTAISMCMAGGDVCKKDTDCPAGERCDPHKGGVCLPGTCTPKGGGCASDHDCCNLACDAVSGSCK
jgi:hypothetical protein